MFLKRIELQGFKSFADKTIIEFNSNVTGIVGPNGCGKSNVNDAIRWVLGEQSAKSLRGGSMSDVIFSGSEKRKAVNMAEVTLVFDNSKRNFDIEYDEVEITRRLFRNSGDAEYLINKSPCRLKDIHNIVMDSGLGRDSLSVISQGNITEFVESKPEERRGLFEEAAGVSKYKKRKHESLNKLNRTQDNLSRVEDIIDELEKRVNPLKRQAKKAEKYIDLKNKLEDIEISVIVDEVDTLSAEIEDYKQKMFDFDSNKAIAEATINIEDQKSEKDRSLMSELDRDIHSLQQRFMDVVNKISSLESRKNEIDEKRKYTLEFANNAEKIKELKNMIAEAEYEYNDKKKRLDDLNVDYNLSIQNFDKLHNKLTELNNKFNEVNLHINKLKNRKEVLENLNKSPFEHQEGVKNVLKAKNSLYGIHGAVSQLILPQEGYENAISYALGGAIYNIVSEDSEAAKQAINYLKKNHGGRATFLPLNVLKARFVNENDMILCNNVDGFLGIASNFVDYDEKFKIIAESLLGNVLLCKNLDSANNLAKIIQYRYKIITIDGDIVHRGGSMSGGEMRRQTTPITISKELKVVNEKLNEKVAFCNNIQSDINKYSFEFEKVKSKNEEIKLAIAKIEPLVSVKQSKLEKLKDEYHELNPNSDMEDENYDTDDLVKELSNARNEKEQIENELSIKREKRFKLGQEVEKRDLKIRELRRDLNVSNNVEKDIEIKKAKAETNLENILTRLTSTYQMTYEHAKSLVHEDINIDEAKKEVLILRNEISKLGNVNLDAPNEFAEVNERYETLVKQRDELNEARNKILDAIDEMDDVMSKQFKEMFDKINNELDGTFKALFGGGNAKLFLVDPNDILNTGIEIKVNPPGKNIKNMQQLSGGEKALLALCVLFSIMKARTMPLCIFDEVEAALDQANVERFARYIGNFKGESQFIVVTHRPGTMAQCESLFGVTMHKDGVSKILSVKLKDAMGYVQEKE